MQLVYYTEGAIGLIQVVVERIRGMYKYRLFVYVNMVVLFVFLGGQKVQMQM